MEGVEEGVEEVEEVADLLRPARELVMEMQHVYRIAIGPVRSLVELLVLYSGLVYYSWGHVYVVKRIKVVSATNFGS